MYTVPEVANDHGESDCPGNRQLGKFRGDRPDGPDGVEDPLCTVPTRFGSRERLQRCVAIMRANGLRALDVQGYRIDDVKGLAVAFARHWLTAKSMATRFAVGEYFDGNPQTLNWWVWNSGMDGRCADPREPGVRHHGHAVQRTG